MQYLFWGINKPGIKAQRAAIIQTHWDYIDRFRDTLIARGPVIEEDDPGNVLGSIHVVDLSDDNAANDFVNNEPFAKAGLYESIIMDHFQLELDRTQFEFKSVGDNPRFFAYCCAKDASSSPDEELSRAHIDYVNGFDKHMICHGAILGPDLEWQGKAFFLEFSSVDKVKKILTGDPFASAGYYKQKIIHGWAMGGPENLNAAGALD